MNIPNQNNFVQEAEVDGIDILADTIEAALHFGLIDNSIQGTFKIIDPETGEVKLDADGNEIKIRGKLNVKGYFEEHMEEWKDLYDNVYEKIREKESPFIKSFEDLLNLQTREAFSEDELNMAVDEEGVI